MLGANDALCSRTAPNPLTTWLLLNLHILKSPTPQKPLSLRLQTKFQGNVAQDPGGNQTQRVIDPGSCSSVECVCLVLVYNMCRQRTPFTVRCREIVARQRCIQNPRFSGAPQIVTKCSSNTYHLRSRMSNMTELANPI